MTGLDISNASLLDEPSAAAEAMGMCFNASLGKKMQFFVHDKCNPNTKAVLETRAKPLGIELVFGNPNSFKFENNDVCGVIIQYPDVDGEVADHSDLVERAHANNALVVCATDLLALTLLQPPGDFGADITIGSAQRFGVPLGYGGPHAGFISARRNVARKLPGRLVGQTIDANGNKCLRLTLQTREQHIRRGKALSNICTAQALLANVAAMYAVYHGPAGLRTIGARVHGMTVTLAEAVTAAGHTVLNKCYFDTIAIKLGSSSADEMIAAALQKEINLRKIDDSTVGISLDETVTRKDLECLVDLFGGDYPDIGKSEIPPSVITGSVIERHSQYLQHAVFNKCHSETEMMRYIKMLENKDISLTHHMIPLGSCTMKLNAATELRALSLPEFCSIHPAAPVDQAAGYYEIFSELEDMLCKITGYDACCLQPNSGAQGEFTGLMAIRQFHKSTGNGHRNICLIPASAHGTNPASASMAGMKCVDVKVTKLGEVDLDDLKAKCEKHSNNLAAMMITYPSTFGVFDTQINGLCDLIHEHGGQVYLDGANMNAQLNMIRPGDIGADVSHLNLHKTFCIPHGGGGPGMGPIGVKKHLIPFLPGNPFNGVIGNDVKSLGSTTGAEFGSSLILTITWAYCKMMGGEGLKASSIFAILNANYMAARLSDDFNIRFTGKDGKIAHEFIIDAAPFKEFGIDVVDIAKRLQDFGLHAPTMSWPLSNALMIEPTESESKDELDRYCDALIHIRAEIREIEKGFAAKRNNVLTNAPHTLAMTTGDEWKFPYSRSAAAWPAPWAAGKVWPQCARVNDIYGDKNIRTTWTDMEET